MHEGGLEVASLNQIGRDRKAALREIDRLLRTVDSKVELLQRLLKRLRSRKLLVPELEEFNKIGLATQDMEKSLGDLINGIQSAATVFNI